jgi:uncharacterized protein (DUF2147 family)
MTARRFLFVILSLFVLGFTLPLEPRVARADDPAPAPVPVTGRWETIDDNTHQPAGIVQTWVEKGKLYGRIEKILKKDAPPDAKCDKCSGYFKDKPIVGLVFMWGLSQDGDEWNGGQILDPENGSTYRCKVQMNGTDKLDVRGFIGISLFGRTQTWNRVKP